MQLKLSHVLAYKKEDTPSSDYCWRAKWRRPRLVDQGVQAGLEQMDGVNGWR